MPLPPDTTRGQRLAMAGLFINLTLAIIKLIAGLLGHSYALVADAIESLTDLVGSAVIWGGLRIAARPADHEHPYGHGRAEALAAFIVAMIVLAAGVGIAIKAIGELLTPHHAPAPFTLWVLIGVIVIKTALFIIVRRAARAEGGSAIITDAWHHAGDAITSLAALVGISVSLIWGYASADDIAALVASAVIVLNAFVLFRAPVRELMDTQPGAVVDRARRTAEQVPGVRGTEKMAARASAGRTWIDLHLAVDPDLSVRDGHAIAHRVKDAIMAADERVADVLIHVEPDPVIPDAGVRPSRP